MMIPPPTFEERIAAVFAMDEATWARHANPWSVWTRVATLPLLVAAIWSRDWIGAWAILPVAVTVAWLWLNPRAFPPPRRWDAWATRGVLGERIWLARRVRPLPPEHRTVPVLLSILAALGALLLAAGLLVLDPWTTVFGTMVTMLAKLWFVDRMVWLYDQTVGTDPPT